MRLTSQIHSALAELDKMAARLPFDLDDARAVGILYKRWVRRVTSRREYLLDLWTYIYVRRYFLVKFLQPANDYTGADLDQVIESAFRRVELKRSSLRDQMLYANWVSVVCKHVYLNFVSRHPPRIGLDRVAEPTAQDQDLLRLHDDAIRATALDAAIGRLPSYLQPVATMRLIDHLEYLAIADRTGSPIASVRAYVHKALTRLRDDAELMDLLGYEPPSSGS